PRKDEGGRMKDEERRALSSDSSFILDPSSFHDACFLPRSSHVTGNVLIHEMAYGVRGQGSGVRGQESGIKSRGSGPVPLTPDPWPLTPEYSPLTPGPRPLSCGSSTPASPAWPRSIPRRASRRAGGRHSSPNWSHRTAATSTA